MLVREAHYVHQESLEFSRERRGRDLVSITVLHLERYRNRSVLRLNSSNGIRTRQRLLEGDVGVDGV